MTILEQLREKKKEWSGGYGMLTGSKSETELLDILSQYDLALENALLKLGNRATQIKDLKHRSFTNEKAISLLNEVINTGIDVDKRVNSDVVIPFDLHSEIFNFLQNNSIDNFV